MAWPSPATVVGRILWHSCTIGDFAVPSDSTLGSVQVECTSKQAIDQKKASGKKKGKSTQQGPDHSPVIIALEGDYKMWEATETMLESIDPNSAATGGPYAFSHPDASRRSIKWIMIEEIGPLKWQGNKFTITIKAVEWEEPKVVAVGGASKTPTKPKDWHNAPMNTHNRADGSVLVNNPDGSATVTKAKHVFNFDSGPIGTGTPPAAGPSAKADPYTAPQAPDGDP